MSKRAALVAAAVFAATAALTFSALSGPDPDAVPTTDQVAKRTMSPYCEGLTLQECPASQSRELRGEISRKIGSGWTNAQIDRWLVDNYGPQVLGGGQPAARLIPVVGVVVGLIALISFLRRKGRGSTEAPEDVEDAGDLASVHAELESFRRGTTE